MQNVITTIAFLLRLGFAFIVTQLYRSNGSHAETSMLLNRYNIPTAQLALASYLNHVFKTNHRMAFRLNLNLI